MTTTGFWTGKRVAVTGGTGFLGQHLVALLRERHARVRVLDLVPGPWPDVPTHVCDIGDTGSVREALANCDVIFHTAGPVAIWGKALATMHAVHCEGTRNVLRAAGKARVVHTSSIVAVAGSRNDTPVDEETPFNLGEIGIPYVAAKRAAEGLALEAAQEGGDVVVVNPAYLIGPEDRSGSVTGKVCKRFWRGKIFAASPGGLNFVDVRDVALGHLLAAERGRAGRRYILGGEDHTSVSLLALLAEVSDMRPRWLPTLPLAGLAAIAPIAELHARFTGREPFPSTGHVRLWRWNMFCDSTRARTELDYRPRPLRECLRDTLTWHRANGLQGPKRVLKWWLRAA
jgi:dihydroflavonol-4-reductase